MRNVGIASAAATMASRTAVAKIGPSVVSPPVSRNPARQASMTNGLTAADRAIAASAAA